MYYIQINGYNIFQILKMVELENILSLIYHKNLYIMNPFLEFLTTKSISKMKRQIPKVLVTSLSNKTKQSLSSYQLSPQEFEALSLNFNFGKTTSTFTHHLIKKSTICLPQTIKKQFRFGNQVKRLSCYKHSAWNHQRQSQLT